MEKDPYSIIRRPLMTEKADFDIDLRNAYHFEVDNSSNKIEIAKAIEKIYNVKVVKVRIISKKQKQRKFRFRVGKTRAWKKAIVFLDKENRIELF